MKLASLLTVVAILLFSTPTFADGWDTGLKVTQIHAKPSGAIWVGFTPQFSTGCSNPGWVSFDSSYMTDAAIERAKSLAVSAKLSNRSMEIQTQGCTTDGFAKLYYLALL
jgi:hypothetical protein